MSDPLSSQTDSGDHRALHMRLLADLAQDLSGEMSFPTSLDLAIRMRNILMQPDLTLEKFTRAVAMEPVIASRLVKLANAQAGDAGDGEERSPVATLQRAIQALGLEQARSVSLGVAMDQIMKAGNLKPFSRYAKLTWEHSIRTALLAQAVARHVGHLNPEAAMLAGLVHDIGIYYLFYRASQYEEYRNDHGALVELVLGWHESIGENVLDALGLPASIIEAVHEHDVPVSWTGIRATSMKSFTSPTCWRAATGSGCPATRSPSSRRRWSAPDNALPSWCPRSRTGCAPCTPR